MRDEFTNLSFLRSCSNRGPGMSSSRKSDPCMDDLASLECWFGRNFQSGFQPVKNGCCNACTMQLARASQRVFAAIYLFRRKPSRALVHQQATDKVPAARRRSLQQLLPRFGGILVELEFAPVREVGALLDLRVRIVLAPRITHGDLPARSPRPACRAS